MKNNQDKIFWSTEDESDEDFETIINLNKKNNTTRKDRNNSKILSSETMDFLWSDDEEETFIDFKSNINEEIVVGSEDIPIYKNKEIEKGNANVKHIFKEDNSFIKKGDQRFDNEKKERTEIKDKQFNFEEEGFKEENKVVDVKYDVFDNEEESYFRVCVKNQDLPNKKITVQQSKLTENNINEFKERDICKDKVFDKKNPLSSYEYFKFESDEGCNEDDFFNFTLDFGNEKTNEDGKIYNNIEEKDEIKSERHQEMCIKVVKKEESLVDKSEDYHVKNIQDGQVNEELKDLNVVFNPSFFNSKDSKNSNFIKQKNTSIKHLEEKIKNLKLEVAEEIEEKTIEEDLGENKNIVLGNNVEFENDKLNQEGLDIVKNNKENEYKISYNVAKSGEKKLEIIHNLKRGNSDELNNQLSEIEKNENIIEKNDHYEQINQKTEVGQLQILEPKAANVSDCILKNPLKVKSLDISSYSVKMTIDKSITSADLNQSFTLNNFRPITCLLKGNVISYYPSIQKRYTKQGITKEQIVNIVNTYILQDPYYLKKSNISSSYENQSLQAILNILKLKDIYPDSVAEIIGAKSVKYATKSYDESASISNINTVMNISTYNVKMAVDFALDKKMWALALIVSKLDKEVLEHVLTEIFDEDKKNILIGEDFVMKQPWKEYFMHFANTQKSTLHDKYINEVFLNNMEDGYLVLVSLHLCKIIDISDYIHYFSHKNQLLDLLLNIHTNFVKINNIDFLMYEYICDIKDRNIEFAKEYYKNYKKEFRKELQNKLDGFLNLNWNFGIKDVLNFGISKILDVQEEPIKNNHKPVSFSNMDGLDIAKTSFNPKNLNGHNKSFKTAKIQNYIYKKDYLQGHFNVVSDRKEVDVSCEENQRTGVNIIIKSEENKLKIGNEMEIEDKVSNTTLPIKNSREVYVNQKHSRSFADFFESEKQDRETVTEDDTSLFLSKYNLDEDDEKLDLKKEKKQSSDTEEKRSFFGIFNMFKKKSYKIDVKASDDIKYDPVTKRWVTGDHQSEVPKESIITNNKIPTPHVKNADPALKVGISKKNLDPKKMSLYAGKKKANTASFSTIKKDVK